MSLNSNLHNKNVRLVLILLLAMVSYASQAQVQVQANMDSVQMMIGEQAHITVEAIAPNGSKIQFPQYKRSQHLVPGIEVLSSTPADTSEMDNGMMRVRKTFTITSFDENVYPISGIKVKVNGKPYEANKLALKVLTVQVDTLHPNQMFPPKDVQDPPFQWSEWSPIFWLSMLVLVLGLLGFYLICRLRANKPIITRIKIVKHIPPHQKALNAIGKIKEEHAQDSEDPKTYYTQLTDTIRQYISERFGFNAKEMTSGDIIARLRQDGDTKKIDELRELFATADLVKFAKYSTLINENDLNLVTAVQFIDETKIEGQPTEERIAPTLSEDQKKVRQNRITIKSLLYGIGIVLCGLIVYIAYMVYQIVG